MCPLYSYYSGCCSYSYCYYYYCCYYYYYCYCYYYFTIDVYRQLGARQPTRGGHALRP